MSIRLLWKAVPLERPRNVLSRALFRFLWCSVGGAITIGVFHEHERIQRVSLIVLLVCVITGIGILVDAFRLLLRPKPNP